MSGIVKIILNKLLIKTEDLSKKAILDTGLTAYSAVSKYNDSRQEGNGASCSVASAVRAAVLMGLVNPWIYLVGHTITSAASHAVEAYDFISAYSR